MVRRQFDSVNGKVFDSWLEAHGSEQVPMSEQTDPYAKERKRLRLRKVYIQLRIPRIKAEIAEIATRKKAMKESGGEASKELTEERITAIST